MPVADAVLTLPRRDPRRVSWVDENVDERHARPLARQQAVIGPDVEAVERDQTIRVIGGRIADDPRLHLEVRALGEEEGSSLID